MTVSRIGAAAPDDDPRSIAEGLRKLADRVERGELIGAAFAVFHPDGAFETGFHFLPDRMTAVRVLGVLQVLATRIAVQYVSEGVERPG